MDMFRNLGQALRLVREKRGFTQAALARHAGIGKSQLSKYENGKENPKFDSLEKLLAVLAIRAVDFFSILAVLDRELERLSSSESGRDSTPLISGLLPEHVQEAFAQLHRNLFALHGVLVGEAVHDTASSPRKRAVTGKAKDGAEEGR
jgi:transcriptional regulator with XRE-family HTH domain